MKHIIEVKNLIFDYFRRDREGNVSEMVEALSDVNLRVKQGDFISIIGANGSGKSTLARNLNALLIPTEGTVLIDGMDTSDERKRFQIRKTAGMVFENPDNQLIGATVAADVAFGPENLGVASEDIREKVREVLRLVGMSDRHGAAVTALSGGQKQKVAIAGLLAMEPACMILDEVTAMLDPEARDRVMELVHSLNREQNMTVIHITHFMEEIIESDYVYMMNGGEIVCEGKPLSVLGQRGLMQECHIEPPLALKMAADFKVALTMEQHTIKGCTLSGIEEALAGQLAMSDMGTVEIHVDKAERKQVLDRSLVFDHVSFRYGKPEEDRDDFALQDVSFVIGRGEFVGLAGHTGSGKSTLLQLMNGLLKPSGGNIYFDGQDIWDASYSRSILRQKVGLVFQYPEQQLFEETVYKDVVFGPYQMQVSKVEAEKMAFDAIRDIGLPESVYDLSPLALSGGQRRKVALAGILAMHPEYLVLDEPAAGLAPAARTELMRYLRGLCDRKNMTVIMVTHSMEDIAEYTDRMLVMQDGILRRDDATRACLRDEDCMHRAGLKMPAAMRMVRQLRRSGLAVQPDIIKEAELLQALV